MLYINDKAKELLNKMKADNIYIVSDFDRTITAGNSESSWGILSKSPMVSDDYKKERQNLFNEYRPIEIDNNIDNDTKCEKMSEWWRKHISLLIKYRITQSIIDTLANDETLMKLRGGAKEFLTTLSQKKVPLVIISAGVGNFVETFLKHKLCYFNNIFILSNFVKFEDGVAIGMKEEVIHSWNKDDAPLPEEAKEVVDDRKYVILFGDIVGDINMAPKDDYHEVLKVGFLDKPTDEVIEEFKNEFDIVCTENSSFLDIANLLNL